MKVAKIKSHGLYKTIIPWKIVIVIILLGVVISTLIALNGRFGFAYKTPTYDVEFLNQDGERHYIAKAKIDEYVIAPPISMAENGLAFTGWDKYTGKIINHMTVRPVFKDLRQEKNIFYMDSYYLEKNDTAWVEIWLGGDVNIQEAELNFDYDEQAIEISEWESAFEVKKGTNNQIQVNISFEKPPTTPTIIARFKVETKENDCFYTKILIEPQNVTEGVGDNVRNAEWAVLNGRIYIMTRR